MNSYINQKLLKLRPLLSALTVLAVTGFTLPQVASAAGVTAGAKIVNVATVEYKSIAGGASLFANAAAVVNVQLKASALVASNPPSATNGNPAKSCDSTFNTYSTGRLVPKLIAVTATANGKDTYNLSMAEPVGTNAKATDYKWYALNYDGTKNVDGSAKSSSPASIALGSAIVLAYDGATNKLIFPGGSLLVGAGPTTILNPNDIVIVELAGGVKMAYLVDTVSAGSKRTHTHEGGAGTGFTDSGNDTANPEVLGYITVKAYPSTSVTLQDGSTVTVGGATPDFTAAPLPATGVPVGQMALIELDVTGVGTSGSTSGSLVDTLAAASNTDATKTASPACTAGNFDPISLKIEKMTRKFANAAGDLTAFTPGAFAKSANGKPGEIMEYEITVTSDKSTGDKIKVTDNVPKYTTLVTYNGAYAGTPSAPAVNTDTIAEIKYGATTATVKGDNTGGTADVGFGSSAALAADSALAFYLGQGSTAGSPPVGGILPFCATDATKKSKSACEAASKTWVTSMTIRYQVKID